MIAAGDVVVLWYAGAQKHKYFVCVDSVRGWFLLINSLPRRRNPQAQVLLCKANLRFLEHDCYADVSVLLRMNIDEARSAVKAEPRRLKGRLNPDARKSIIEAGRSCDVLPPIHLAIIEDAFKPVLGGTGQIGVVPSLSGSPEAAQK